MKKNKICKNCIYRQDDVPITFTIPLLMFGQKEIKLKPCTVASNPTAEYPTIQYTEDGCSCDKFKEKGEKNE